MDADPGDDRFERLRAQLAPPDGDDVALRTTGPVAGSVAGSVAGPVAGSTPTVKEAAVAMIVRASAEMEVLLVRRAVHPRDPWSGHIALPGGRREDVDRTILHTAIRETREETGVLIAPETALGRLPPVTPQGVHLPALTVTPFVFGVPERITADVASPELDAVFWVGLPELLDPANRGTIDFAVSGVARTFPAFTVQGQVVWGLTYRILSRFLDRVSSDPRPSRQ